MGNTILRIFLAVAMLLVAGYSQAYSISDCKQRGGSYICVDPAKITYGPAPQDVVGPAYPSLPPDTSSCTIMGAGNSGHVETRNAAGKLVAWTNAMQQAEGQTAPPGWDGITACLPPPGDKYYGLNMASGGATYSCPATYVMVSDSQSQLCLAPLNPVNDGCDCPQACEGHPINVATGNKFLKEVDYVGSGAYPLEFSRYYNSFGGTDGNMGVVWSHTYAASLKRYTSTGQDMVLVSRPDGKIHVFNMASLPNPEVASVNFRLSQISSGDFVWDLHDMERDRHEFYDAKGRLRKITERSGFSKTLTYTDAGPNFFYLTKVEDDFGRKILFNVEGLLIKSITLPDGNVISYSYFMGYDGNLMFKVTRQDGAMRQYGYEYYGRSIYGTNNNAVTVIVDEKNVEFARYDYDWVQGHGRAVLSQRAGGVEAISVNYYANDSTYVTDALGKRKTISFTNIDGMMRRTAATAPCNTGCSGLSQSVTYDANGNVASLMDFMGNVTTYAYDLSRNLETSRTEAYGTSKARTITTTWHSNFRLPLTVTEPGRVTSYTYDSNGNRLTKTVTDSATSQTQVWTWTYNSVGQVLTEDGPRTDVSDVTTYTYFGSTSPYYGNLATITNAAGQVTQFTSYDANGHLLSQTDPNGIVTTYTYDSRGRQLTRSSNSKTTTYEYDPVGQMTKVTLPDGNWVAYVYDDAHRLTEIRDKAGNKIVYTLDLMSRRTKEEVKDTQGGLASLLDWIKESLTTSTSPAGPQG